MNVLYYLAEFPKLSESFILNELYELERRGHTVVVFALSDPDEDIVHREYDELDIRIQYADTLDYTDVIDLASTKVVHPNILKNALFRASPETHGVALHRSKQCIDFVNELDFDIDIVHTHFATLRTFPARYVSAYYGVPCTATVHAYDLYEEPNRKQLAHVLGRFDHVVTVSEYNRRHIRTRITDATPISVVRAGIRPDKFEPTTDGDDTRILTVSRFVTKKGLPYAVEALSKIADQFPGITYHMIGSGPTTDEVRERIRECGLTDTVELLRNVDDERLLTEYDRASCFVLPSVVAESGDRDGIPVALMEAMSMETPPISTEVSGIPELVDHQENGLLTDPRDSDALADALRSMLSDPDKQRRFGRAARRKVEREFNIAREVTKLETVFTRTIERRGTQTATTGGTLL